MVQQIKTLATKRNITFLVIAHFILGLIGSVIYFAWLDSNNISEWFGQSYVIASTITHLLGYITPVLLLIATRSMDKANADKVLAGVLIVGIIISISSSFIAPAIIGLTFTGGSVIGHILLLMPAVFIIVDIFREHKLGKVSCILCVVMACIQVLAFIVNIINTARYGVFQATSILPAFTSVVYWAILLLHLIRHIQVPESKIEEPISYESYTAEQRLHALKVQYDNGEITEEEYREIKEIILQSYISKEKQ